jgi:hypothetical protein
VGACDIYYSGNKNHACLQPKPRFADERYHRIEHVLLPEQQSAGAGLPAAMIVAFIPPSGQRVHRPTLDLIDNHPAFTLINES